MSVERVLIGVALVMGVLVGYWIARTRIRGRRSTRPESVHQILLPFTGTSISRRALDAALRLAKVENSTLMPAYLAIVPKDLPLECAIAKEAETAMPMLEAIEQRAAGQGVDVDSRIERGRSYRHALGRLLEREHFDRVVVPATAQNSVGFSDEDLVWLLGQAPAEVLILRPGPTDTATVRANGAGVVIPA